MAHNTDLEQRVEENFPMDLAYSKKKMFGGIAWLLNGNMCFGIHKDYLIIRIGQDYSNQIANNSGVSEMDITGKAMKGWKKVELSALSNNDELKNYLQLAEKFVSSLPSK
ncbi:MAG: TfoX/Sxy family protein [Pseudomonadota bacterium]